MRLSNAKFKISYNSYQDDLINDFYIKALSLASNYDRVSAYFDSKILSLYSSGISEIYKNNGKIRFIFSCNLEERDFDLMKEGYANRKEIENKLLGKLSNCNISDIDKKRLSNLAFLIKNGIVDIKIAFTREGIFHDKFGLIYNNDGDYLYFRGSNNETEAAILRSYESFETSCNWNNEVCENQKIDIAVNTYETLWNNKINDVIVLEIPDVVNDELLKYNNGELILENDIFSMNSIVIDLDDNKNLIVKNNTNPNYDLARDWTYKNFIKKYVKNQENDMIYFYHDLNYVTMDKITNLFSDCCTKNSLNFVVTNKLRDYIINKNLEIEKRKNLGIDIKNESDIVKSKYNEFKRIVDKEMQRKLRDKQMWDAFHIVSMWKSANFSVPGTGKTSIVYGAFAYLNSSKINKVDKIIMIGPKNSFMAWKDEFYENFGDKKTLCLINIQDADMFKNRNQKISQLRFDSANKNLILINYDILNSLEDVLKEIIDERTMLVFDEVHKVKAVNGKRAKAALNICAKAKYKIILTGTPIPNSYQDIYNLLNILFIDEYKTYFKYTPNELIKPNDTLMQDINSRIYPFYCRTTKKDLEIPAPNKDDIIRVKMNGSEKKIFEMLRKKYNGQALTLYIRLLQASTNPKLLLEKIDDQQIETLFSTEDDEEEFDGNYLAHKVNKESHFNSDEINIINSVKTTGKFLAGIDKVVNLVNDGKQVLVWGIFISTLNNIKCALNDKKINCKIIDGGVLQEDREKIIKEFKSNEFSVLITNPHTMAESVSLHKNCHDAVYFEYSFNLTHMLQSRDRINRLGLPENQYTQYYYLMLINDDYFCDSIDERTYNRLKEKEQIMIESIEGTTLGRAQFDDYDDILRILNTI